MRAYIFDVDGTLTKPRLKVDNNIIDIKSNNPDEDISNIINELTKANISINKLNVKKANLEDVFIKLTGKSISNDE